MKPLNILFLCTGNSARSILSEMCASDPVIGCGRLKGYSAGSFPTGQVHPAALETLQAHGIATLGARSKSWDEFAVPDAPQMQIIVTVCDRAAAESCPIWPGHPATAHWGVPDPAAVTSDQDEQRRAFEAAFDTLSRRVHALASLDLFSLSSEQITQEARRIGEQVK